MSGTQTDIREILTELQNAPEILSKSHRKKMEHCLRHFQAKGLTLEVCADKRHLNRSISTLKGYARDLRLRFPDFVPMACRTAEELKATWARKKKAAPE